MDAIPVFSQVKSLVQFVFKDAEGARQTQINFSRQCPVVSQIRSAVESAQGDQAAALETQKHCLNFLGAVVSGVPVVGHIKGGVHYICGDKERGDASMKAASHTSAVIGGGVCGFLVGGPVGSVVGGITAGAAIDSTITATDSAINKTFKPYGIFEPALDPKNPGKWCDAAGGIIFDGIAGRCAGKVVQQVQLRNVSNPGAVLDSIVETAIEERFIPRPVVSMIFNEVKLWISGGATSIAFKLRDVCEKHLDKALSEVPIFDEKHCKLDMKDEKVVTENSDINDLGVSFKQNGDVIEVYYQENLILLKNGDLKYIANGKGGMERMKDGVAYGLSKDGIIVEVSTLEQQGNEALKGRSNTDEEEGDCDKWFDAAPAEGKFIEFSYDTEQKKILWGEPEEEHKGLLAPTLRRSMLRV